MLVWCRSRRGRGTFHGFSGTHSLPVRIYRASILCTSPLPVRLFSLLFLLPSLHATLKYRQPAGRTDSNLTLSAQLTACPSPLTLGDPQHLHVPLLRADITEIVCFWQSCVRDSQVSNPDDAERSKITPSAAFDLTTTSFNL